MGFIGGTRAKPSFPSPGYGPGALPGAKPDLLSEIVWFSFTQKVRLEVY